MHIAGPRSLTPLGVIRWIITAGTLFVGTVIAEENIRRFAEEKHWNELLTGAAAAMPDLSPFTENHWTWFIFGLFAGVSLALWMARLSASPQEIIPSSTTIQKSRIEKDFPTTDWDKPLVDIFRQHYKNETVQLDGKNFVECTFENVTFVYQGMKGIQMINCAKIPAEGFYVTVRTDNPVVLTALGIMQSTGVSGRIEYELHNKDNR